MIENLHYGQVVWFNNIDFTTSGSVRKDSTKQPTLCTIVGIDIRQTWFLLEFLPLSSNQKTFFTYLPSSSNNLDYDRIHLSKRESIISYNKKIDKKIDWYKNYLEEGNFNTLLTNRAMFPSSSKFKEKSTPLPLQYILGFNDREPDPLGFQPHIRNEAAHVGYILMSSKKFGISLPWYPWEIDTVVPTDDSISCSLRYYKTISIDIDDYGKSFYSSIYNSLNDLYSGFVKNYENLVEDVQRQVEKKIKSLEKLKILI